VLLCYTQHIFLAHSLLSQSCQTKFAIHKFGGAYGLLPPLHSPGCSAAVLHHPPEYGGRRFCGGHDLVSLHTLAHGTQAQHDAWHKCGQMVGVFGACALRVVRPLTPQHITACPAHVVVPATPAGRCAAPGTTLKLGDLLQVVPCWEWCEGGSGFPERVASPQNAAY